MLKKILLYINTIKYLKPVQIYGRVFSKLKSKIPKNYTAPNKLETRLKFKTNFIKHDPWNNRDTLIKGAFCFLNQKLNLSFPPKWNPEADLLWQFNLHYFHYLYLLDDNEKEKIVLDWIEKNPIGMGSGWHPYVISLRLINWIREDFTHPEIIKSIYLQADYLSRNLEFYHPANHYLENAKALVFAGIYFQNDRQSKKWLEKGKDIFRKELPKQVLNDGTYFEITPMYHAKILEGLLDIYNVLDRGDEFTKFLIDYLKRMLIHLEWTTHPDGKIALINDSTHEIVPSTNNIQEYAFNLGFTSDVHISNKAKLKFFKDSGLGIIHDQNFYFIIKAGKIGPDEIPAHAHADIFSYELSILGEQFIVDSGVYEYISGEMRDYSRSTSAHNTVEIDGVNQCEVWGSHRVARRYKPTNILWKENEDIISFNGVYNGYSNIIGDKLIHSRKVDFNKKENSLIIFDNVKGKGEHSALSYIHIHPEIECDIKDNIVLIKKNNVNVELKINGNYNVKESWYSPQFGEKIKNKSIAIQVPLNKEISYSFKKVG